MTYDEMLQDLEEFKEKKEAYQRGEIDDDMSDGDEYYFDSDTELWAVWERSAK